MAEGGYSSGSWGQAGWGCSVYDRSLTDTTNASDFSFGNSRYVRNVFENATATDVTSGNFPFVSCRVSESVLSNDAITNTLFYGSRTLETVNTSDSASVFYIAGARIQETTNATVLVNCLANFNSLVENSCTSNDVVFGTRVVEVSVSDAASASVTLESKVLFGAVVSEVVNAFEEAQSRFGLKGLIEESLIAEDKSFAVRSTFAELTENAAANSAASALAIFLTTVFESIAAEEGDNTSLSSANFINEGVSVSDILRCRFLWEIIDTGDTEVWNGINTGNTSVWNSISTGSQFTWSNINTGNSDVWVSMTIGDASVWTDINSS